MISLPIITEDNTTASVLRKLYISKYTKVKDVKKKLTLNSLLGINGSLDLTLNSIESFVASSCILFGIGNGGTVDNDLTISNIPTIGSVTEGSNDPAVVSLSNPSGYLTRDNLHLNSILPLKYTPDTKADTRYGLNKRGLINSVMYNKYHVKLAKVYMSAVVPADGGEMETVLQVHCIVSKAEAGAATETGDGFENTNEFIDELAIYFGRAALIPNKEKVVAGIYPTYKDFIQVVPTYYTRFDRIYLSNIPETGLDFIFEINLGVTDLLDSPSRISGIENLAYVIS